MKLSQSVYFIRNRQSKKKLPKIQSEERMLAKDQQSQPVRIQIKISKHDELEPAFVQTFSKIIINNTNFDFQQCYGDIKTTTYAQFYETLKNLRNQINRAKPWKDFNQHIINLKTQQKMGFKKAKSYQNVRKSSIEILPKKEPKKYLFCFQAHYNSVVLLIDLSPYMLLYDYSTKSFLLQNAQQIVRDLFIQLQNHYNQRKNGNSGPSYFVSCYIFSIYQQKIEQVMRDQEIFFSDVHEKKYKNHTIISDYICASINRSKLPHQQIKDKNPISISKIIPKVLNIQQGKSGIKTLVTISAFKQFDSCPYIFFNSNWYTFCFICAGELNFGSFLIDTSQIVNRFSKNSYLDTKFVYKSKFMENWQKVRMIERQGLKFKYLDTSVKKGRAILYITSNGQKKQSIFQDILKFNLKLNEKRKKGEGAYKSNQSMAIITKNQRLINQYQFNIPVENISQIMRTKYLQGWQQIPTQNYPQNTKYLFRLQFASKTGIIYNATRTQDYFNVKVSTIVSQPDPTTQQQKMKAQRKQITQKIKKIDMVNTSNFDIVTAFKHHNIQSQIQTKTNKLQKIDKNYKYYLNLDSKSMDMLNQLQIDHQEWNCYFKVKKIYLHFTPNLHFLNDLNLFLNQIKFLFGERINNLFFIQRKQIKQKLVDNIKDREVSKWNVMFVKVSGILRFIQLKFGFLKYSDIEIRQAIQNIENKLTTKKFANGSVKLIPQDIYSYCIQKFDDPKILKKSLCNVFQKSWKITFKNQYLCKIFTYMNSKIIKKLKYHILRSKLENNYYYKTIIFPQKQNKKQRGIFLHITQVNNKCIQFKIEAFPSFSINQNVNIKQMAQNFSSQKNVYQQFTQRSISSSNRQNSIVSASLPFISNNSIKQIAVNKQNQNKNKNSFFQLFQILVQEVKQSQKSTVNLVKCYAEIYDQLIKKRLEEKKSGLLCEQLIKKIKQLYKIPSQDFQAQFLSIILQIKKQYYNQQPQQQKNNLSRRQAVRIPSQQNFTQNSIPQTSIDQIPQPVQYLMQSQITTIKGDLTLVSKFNMQKKYIFFLLTPNQVVYVYKRPGSNKIYFRGMSNIYSHFSPIEKQQKELIERINKQLKQQQYLAFYNLIADEKSVPQSPGLDRKISQQKQNLFSLIHKKQQLVSSFTGITINCSQILNILQKQQNRPLQPRMTKVLLQYNKSLFQAISLFFQPCQLQINTHHLINQQFYKDTYIYTGQTDLKIQKQYQNNNQNMLINSMKSNNFLYQKKQPFFQQKTAQKFNIKNQTDFNNFQNIVLKICTHKKIPIDQKNLLYIFLSKNRIKNQQSYESSSQTIKNNKLQIHLNFYGFEISKQSLKIKWLNQIIQQITTQCIMYLNILSITQPNQIKQVQNKLSEYIIKGPFQKIPDDLWNQSQIVRQIQSGHMQSIIPFFQYSSKQFPAKFISKQIQVISSAFLPKNKSNQIFYLKYWLTLQITPAKILKTRLIPFKYINLSTQIILNMSKLQYETQINKMIQFYMAELIKFMKIRNIFKTIEHKLMFPLQPSIPIFINFNIFNKLQEEKRKSTKIKAPKKFKHRVGNHPGLQLKSSNSAFQNSISAPTLSTNSTVFSSGRINQSIDDNSYFKNYLKLPLIYQGTITYFPKFQPQEIFSLLACCQKLNPYAIRNLDNTYIFFNLQIKEYFIFYLQQPANIMSSSLSIDSLNKSQLSVYSSTTNTFQRYKNNTLLYSVYCIDQTVEKAVIQKYHGGLIKKALQQVTFYKIAKSLHHNCSTIDQPQQQYFKQGQKQQVMFKLPYIINKSNLNQYIKQHMQKAFYHKKTQFKSQLKKKEIVKINTQNNQQYRLNRKYLVKGSNKIATKSLLTHFQQCDLRCVPQTWIFNTIQERTLQQNFGKCLFLTRIIMIDSHESAGNALFWNRHLKQYEEKKNQKTYIYPYMSGNIQQDATYNQKNILNYLQAYGQRQAKERRQSKSSHYFNVENRTSGISTQTQEIHKNKYKYEKKEDYQKLRFGESLEYYTILKFQIFSSLGFPRFKLIQNMYQQLVCYGLYDYYLENRLFRELFANFELMANNTTHRTFCQQKSSINQLNPKQQFKQQKQDHLILERNFSANLQRVSSTPSNLSVGRYQQKSKQSFYLLGNNEFVDHIYESYLKFLHTLQSQIIIKRTSCVFLYKTENRVLIEDKTCVLFDFIKKIADDLQKQAKFGDKISMRFVIYGIHKKTNQIKFWAIQIQRFEKQSKQQIKSSYNCIFQQINHEIEIKNLDFSKMGVFFCDNLFDLDSLRQSFFFKQDKNLSKQQRFLHTFNRSNKSNIEFETMKKFQQGRSFCQNQYLFKRSLLLHFQVSDNQFLCYLYNFKNKQIQTLINYLEQMQIWFAQKHRLYNFIVKIKKNQLQQQPIQYEIPPPPQANSTKKHFISQQKQLNRETIPKTACKRKYSESHQIVQQNLSKIIKIIAFQQLPYKNFIKSRPFIEKMYKILSQHTIPYHSYPQYKGKQKSKLFRIARQYLSIIRYYFGVEKSIKKQNLIQLQQKPYNDNLQKQKH